MLLKDYFYYDENDVQYMRCINPGLDKVDFAYDYKGHPLKDFIDKNKDEIMTQFNSLGFRSFAPFSWIDRDICMADFIRMAEEDKKVKNIENIKDLVE
ncbi:MAG: hypothetical protein LBU62_11150 [Bacteroidales bacterium]|jgi:hypothetical protein|nr:hypothetical protein [Bacteroidales bacterium]